MEQDHRTKLIEQLYEQKKMAEGILGGTPYVGTKQVWTDGSDGNRVRVERPVRARQWWKVGSSGAVQFGLRYGAIPLELQPGKTAVKVTKLAELPLVIAIAVHRNGGNIFRI